MRKYIVLPALALAGGAAGFGLRLWQLRSAYVPQDQLFVPGAPATLALLGLTAGIMVLFLLLVWGGRRPGDFLPALACPSPVFMTLMASGAFLVLGSAALRVLDGLELLELWQTYPDSMPYASPLVALLTAALSVPAGFGLLLLGRSAYRSHLTAPAMVLSSFPGLACVSWVLATHLAHGVDPVLMGYAYELAAAAFLALTHYYAAGYLYGVRHPHRMAFCGLTGVFLACIALADHPAPANVLMLAGLALSALGLTVSLLYHVFGPQQPVQTPPPAEDSPADPN